MAHITVGDIRKAIDGMNDSDPVSLDMSDPPEDSDWRLDGVGNYGGVLQISVSDRQMTGYDDDEMDEDEEGSDGGHCMKCGEPLDDSGECDCPEID